MANFFDRLVARSLGDTPSAVPGPRSPFEVPSAEPDVELIDGETIAPGPPALPEPPRAATPAGISLAERVPARDIPQSLAGAPDGPLPEPAPKPDAREARPSAPAAGLQPVHRENVAVPTAPPTISVDEERTTAQPQGATDSEWTDRRPGDGRVLPREVPLPQPEMAAETARSGIIPASRTVAPAPVPALRDDRDAAAATNPDVTREETVIRVSIGRVEVRVAQPAPAKTRERPARPAPRVGLDAYLERRGRTG